jgi:large subunit ribosomal protein L22
MSPESENPDAPLEDAAGAETGRSSEEPETTTEAEDTRPVSAADASSTEAASDEDSDAQAPDTDAPAAEEEQEPVADADDEEPEAEAEDDQPEAEAEAPERPKRARRPRRKAAGTGAAEKPAKPSQPAPRRRRAQREPGVPAPVVRAQAKYVRSSARKARLVCDHIRGKSVDEARAILALTPRAIAQDWSKLLESAVANAEHNHELVGEDLYVKAVHADEGPTIKRFRPRAMGRATRIRKRTSHLTILLTPKD